MPKVSVIVPVYGVEKYIERCARCLFEQTLNDIEYLFIDDCTPDRSIEILRTVLEDYPHRKEHVIIHRMEQNSGQAKVREWGMKRAKGVYVIHCDSDDWIDARMYEKMYDYAVETNSDIVFCDYYILNGDNTIVVSERVNEHLDKENLLKWNLVTDNLNQLWAALVKRELLRPIEYPKGNLGEDKVIMIQACYYANSVAYLRESLYYYLIRKDSICRQDDILSITRRVTQYYENKQVILNFLESKGLSAGLKNEIEYVKANIKFFLYLYLSNPECRELWRSLFPEVRWDLYFNPYVTLRQKILFFLGELKLFYYYIFF